MPQVLGKKLKLAYSIRGLARELDMDHQILRRLLIRGFKEQGVPVLRQGKLWLSDIRKYMPTFYESWEEQVHRNFMERQSSVDDEDDS